MKFKILLVIVITCFIFGCGKKNNYYHYVTGPDTTIVDVDIKCTCECDYCKQCERRN